MPLVSGQYDGPLLGFGVQLTYALLKNFTFDALPLPVELAQLHGQLLRPGRALGEKQLHRHLGHSHSSGGVDSGGQGVAHGDGAHRFILQPGAPDQGGEAQPPGRVQPLQPLADNGPVGPRHGHHIGHRAHGGQIAKLVEDRRALRPFGHGQGQHQRHPHSGQSFKGVEAVGPVGVHHRGGGWQGFLAGVVVGNDHVNAQAASQGGLLHGGNAAVYRDDKGDALIGQGVDRLLIQTVALSQAAGDVGDHISAPGGEKLGEKTGRGNAVHIVVAVDGDQLSPFQGQPHPADGQVHVPQKRGVRNRLLVGGEKPAGVFRADHTPGGQQPGQQRRQAGPLQGPLTLGARGGHLPVLIFQWWSPPPVLCRGRIHDHMLTCPL